MEKADESRLWRGGREEKNEQGGEREENGVEENEGDETRGGEKKGSEKGGVEMRKINGDR